MAKKIVKKVAPKKKAAPKKKKAAVKKVAAAGSKKKVVAKKKVAPKKKKVTVKKVAAAVSKRKVVAKKVAPKKKKAAVKKAAVAKKKVAVKKVVAVKKTVAKKVASPQVKLIEKSAPSVKVAAPKAVAKPLSRNQLKKSSAKKRSSERESLLDATFTPNPKTPKLNLPVDPKALKLCKAIVNAIEEKKGDNIIALDLRNIENRVCDYFIICEGNSSTQIDAIAGSVEFLIKRDLGERPYRSEGYENKTWILIDYVNVIVHVFDKETRYFYNLESLWADGEQIKF